MQAVIQRITASVVGLLAVALILVFALAETYGRPVTANAGSGEQGFFPGIAHDAEDSLHYILRWNRSATAPAVPDSYAVTVTAHDSRSGRQSVLFDRIARQAADSFRVGYPFPGATLTFAGTVRAITGNLPSAPFGTLWKFPPSEPGFPARDSADSNRWEVDFSTSPGPTPPRTPTSGSTQSPRVSRDRNRQDTARGQPSNAEPPPVPTRSSAGCSNEPAGFESLAEVGWRDVPPRSEEKKGRWVVTARPDRFRVTSDPAVPQPDKRVLEGRFPRGAPGGAGPFRLTHVFSRPVSSVYMCIWLKVSENFTDNGNTGTKFGFLLTPYNTGNRSLNHYFNLTKRLGINLQSSRAVLNRLMTSSYGTLRNLGQWHRVEWLTVSNRQGGADGVARIWVDGAPVLNENNVRYFFPEQEPAFTGVTWNPTYGGGRNPVPHDMFVWVGDWYISGH